MYHTVSLRCAQQRFVQDWRGASNCLSTFNLLTNDWVFEEIERAGDKYESFPFVTDPISAPAPESDIMQQLRK